MAGTLDWFPAFPNLFRTMTMKLVQETCPVRQDGIRQRLASRRLAWEPKCLLRAERRKSVATPTHANLFRSFYFASCLYLLNSVVSQVGTGSSRTVEGCPVLS